MQERERKNEQAKGEKEMIMNPRQSLFFFFFFLLVCPRKKRNGGHKALSMCVKKTWHKDQRRKEGLALPDRYGPCYVKGEGHTTAAPLGPAVRRHTLFD